MIMAEGNYISRIRKKIGHDPLIMLNTFGLLWDDNHQALLLEQRADIPDGWSFPGGFVEFGESPDQTIVREFKEELSIDVEVQQIFEIGSTVNLHNSWGDAQENVSMGFIVKYLAGDIKVDGVETLSAEFVPIDPEPKMFVPSAQTNIHRIINRKDTNFPWIIKD